MYLNEVMAVIKANPNLTAKRSSWDNDYIKAEGDKVYYIHRAYIENQYLISKYEYIPSRSDSFSDDWEII